MSEMQIEAFYDGDCPLCMREVRFLGVLDRGRGRIRFTNIADPDFDPDSLGIEWSAFMRRMHGRLPDGTWVEGVEVFRRMYAAVGFGPVVWLSRAPGVRALLDWLYHRFAENRLRLTGRCSETCELPARPTRAAS